MNSYILITGAAGGLGKAFVTECALRGRNLFLTDLSDSALAILAAGTARLYNVSVRYLSCDLTDPASTAAFWKSIYEQRITFQGLINVAGIDCEGGFCEHTAERLARIVRINSEGVVDITRRILQYKDPAGRFMIINVASMAGFYPMPLKATYAASKRFLISLSLALRQELKKYNVSVTVLCPAGLPTTEECIRLIEVQGFMGRLTTKNTGYVAAKTISRALRGRALYIPGLINQLLRYLGGMVPETISAYLLGRRWEKIRNPVP